MEKTKTHLDYLFEGVTSDLQLLETVQTKVNNGITALVAEAVGFGKPMVFTDKTGYPIFVDSDGVEDILNCVTAIRVVRKASDFYMSPTLEFYTKSLDGDVEPEEDGWFDPTAVFGTYDHHDLFYHIHWWRKEHTPQEEETEPKA